MHSLFSLIIIVSLFFFGCATANPPTMSAKDRNNLSQYVQLGFDLGLRNAKCASVEKQVAPLLEKIGGNGHTGAWSDPWRRTVRNALVSGCVSGNKFRETGDEKYREVKVEIEGEGP
jgi:hypothetical protein